MMMTARVIKLRQGGNPPPFDIFGDSVPIAKRESARSNSRLAQRLDFDKSLITRSLVSRQWQ